MTLTSIILTKNNESTIKDCLNSISSLNSTISIFDFGSKDTTIPICESQKIKVKKTSRPRIEIITEAVLQAKTKWILHIHPWEKLICGEEKIKEILSEETVIKPRLCNIIDGNIITKEVRLWPKELNLAFTGANLETLIAIDVIYEEIFLLSNKPDISYEVKGTEFHYYEAFKALKAKDYDKFLSSSSYYLFYQKTKTISSTMMRYYQGIVKCFVKNNYQEAIEIAILCIAENILMAEFWCLLGDIYFELKEFNKSILFYENAIILGSKRPKSDRWPIHINKYKEHPQEMISKCKEILSTAITLPSLPSRQDH